MRAQETTGTGRRPSSPFFLRALLAFVLLCAAVGTAGAFNFEPIVQDFSPSGQGSVQTFRVTNNGTELIAVRVRITSRVPNYEGKEATAPVAGLFVLYPERMLLEPGTFQSVRVQWTGPAKLDTEQCFRIIAEQLPVDVGGKQKKVMGAIRILFRYIGAIYVLPTGAKPDVEIVSWRAAVDGEGREGLELVFANRGTAHTMLENLELTVGDKVFGSEELEGISGENILPGLKRRFFVPVKGELPEGDPLVSFRFDPQR